MERGWLDTALLALLEFLDNPWLSVIVPVGGGLALGYLARRSPRRDWDRITELPGKVLFGVFLVLAAIKSLPRLVVPSASFLCDREPSPLSGILVETNCRLATAGTFQTVYDYTLGDYLRDFVVFIARDCVLGVIGLLIGIAFATVVTRRWAHVRS